MFSPWGPRHPPLPTSTYFGVLPAPPACSALLTGDAAVVMAGRMVVDVIIGGRWAVVDSSDGVDKAAPPLSTHRRCIESHSHSVRNGSTFVHRHCEPTATSPTFRTSHRLAMGRAADSGAIRGMHHLSVSLQTHFCESGSLSHLNLDDFDTR